MSDDRERLDKLFDLSYSDNISEARSALEKARRIMERDRNTRSDSRKISMQTTKLVNVGGRTVDLSTEKGRRMYQILRHYDIMYESQDLVNTSKNLSTVLSRLETLIQELTWLTKCSDNDLKMCKLKTSQELKKELDKLTRQKPGIINSGIKRAAQAAIDHAKTLKTTQGQIRSIDLFIEKSLTLPGLYPENIKSLEHIRAPLHKQKQ